VGAPRLTDAGVRLVVLDIDGTLLGAGHRVSERNRAAIRACREAGIAVALCTGRPSYGCRDVLAALDLETEPGIFCNGASVATPDRSRIIAESCLEPGLAAELARDAADLPLEFYTATVLWAARLDPGIRIQAERTGVPVETGDLVALAATTPVIKGGMVVRGAGREAARRLAEQQAGRLRWEVAHSLLAPDADFINITTPDVSKGAALLHLAAALGVPQTATLAIGDAYNDLPLLEAAGIGVAMGNAVDDLKAIADHVTAPVDDDGVAAVLEQLV
jgi:hypothetical protein